MSCSRRLGYVAAAAILGLLPGSALAGHHKCKCETVSMACPCSPCETCSVSTACSPCGTCSVSTACACGEQPCTAARVEGSPVIYGTVISDSCGACCKPKRQCGLCSWLWHGGKCHTCETAMIEYPQISGAPCSTCEIGTTAVESKPRCAACGTSGRTARQWESEAAEPSAPQRELKGSEREQKKAEQSTEGMKEESGRNKSDSAKENQNNTDEEDDQ